MANTIHIDIVSAEGQIFSGEASMVFVPGSQGELGIYPRHAPLLTTLSAGEDSRDAHPLPQRVYIERILTDQHAAKAMHQGRSAHRRIGRFTLTIETGIGINAHVGLGSVHQHLRGADIGDLNLGPLLRSAVILNRSR